MHLITFLQHVKCQPHLLRGLVTFCWYLGLSGALKCLTATKLEHPTMQAVHWVTCLQPFAKMATILLQSVSNTDCTSADYRGVEQPD